LEHGGVVGGTPFLFFSLFSALCLLPQNEKNIIVRSFKFGFPLPWEEGRILVPSPPGERVRVRDSDRSKSF
jgi:hypothetical protein